MSGEWRVEDRQQVTGESCKAGGTLESTHQPPLLQADYTLNDYDIEVHAASPAEPFQFTGVQGGSGPCATAADVWSEWVGSQLRSGADPLDAVLTVPQLALRAVRNHGTRTFSVHPLPLDGLRTTDCGSTPGLGITCTQSFEWTGRVEVRPTPARPGRHGRGGRR